MQREFARAAEQGRQPSVFHFLGHGDDDGLYFENEHGEAHLVKGHELKAALAQSPVKVALLNACWSATKRGVSLIEFLTREQVAGKPEGLCVLVTQRLHGHPMMLELAVGVALRGRKQLEQALVELPDDLEQQLAALLATSLQYLGERETACCRCSVSFRPAT